MVSFSPSSPVSTLLGGAALVWVAGAGLVPAAPADGATHPADQQIRVVTLIQPLLGCIPLVVDKSDSGGNNSNTDTSGGASKRKSGSESGGGSSQQHKVHGSKDAQAGQTDGGKTQKPQGGAGGGAKQGGGSASGGGGDSSIGGWISNFVSGLLHSIFGH